MLCCCDCLVSFDKAFADVITNCANRDVTWINQTICQEYEILHSKGLAHSVEIWKNGNLVGGLYGLALGAVFFAESMFSKISNASINCMPKSNSCKTNLNGLTRYSTAVGLLLYREEQLKEMPHRQKSDNPFVSYISNLWAKISTYFQKEL